jgi:transposase-like protein
MNQMVAVETAVEEISAGGPVERVVPAPGPRGVEVAEKPERRRHTTEYKLRVLREADRCTAPGEVGALLRREGLYSSLLSWWRRQRERGEIGGLMAKKRGRKAAEVNPLSSRVRELEKENATLTRRLRKAETILEIQKKASELLGIPLKSHDIDEND